MADLINTSSRPAMQSTASVQPSLQAIAFDGVRKQFGSTTVLDGISLNVAAGERLVLCGPSGSGKSTLIRCVNGLEQHDGGSIVVDGIVLDGSAAALARIRAEVGMVFQQFNLFAHKTVLENCTLALRRVRRLSKAEANDLALHYLERVHIPEQANKYPAQLSGGQQQRVAIARALCMKPRIMLYDEPTSALDPEMVHEVLDTMAEVADAGMTTICVTHEMGFAARFADRVVFMDQGRLVESGSPEEIFTRPKSDRLQRFLSKILPRH